MSFLFRWRAALTACARSELSPTERWVAVAVSLHMNANGCSCWPSLERISGETGYSVSAVCKALDSLERKGWIVRDRGGGAAYPGTLEKWTRKYGGTVERRTYKRTEGDPLPGGDPDQTVLLVER